jgi:hypothetical protein
VQLNHFVIWKFVFNGALKFGESLLSRRRL